MAESAKITGIVPQVLVDRLDESVTYYRDKLGFDVGFIYDGFYAGVVRDGFSIHLKCAPVDRGAVADRRENEHLAAHIDVEGVESLYRELQGRGARIVKRLEKQPWHCTDFYVEDVDGHLLCFSELQA